MRPFITYWFHYVLKGGTGDSDGTGGSYSESGTVFTGAITVAGRTGTFFGNDSLNNPGTITINNSKLFEFLLFKMI